MDAILNFVDPIFKSNIGIAIIVIAIISLIVYIVISVGKSNKCAGFKTQESCNNTSHGKCVWNTDKCLVK